MACVSRGQAGLVLVVVVLVMLPSFRWWPGKERRRKTGKLPAELVTILRSHRAAQAAERLAAANVREDCDLVFCRWNGDPVDPRQDWQEWKELQEAAGVAHRGVHGTRHTAATLAIDEGVALTVVKEMLGHSDIRVTEGYVQTSSPMAQGASRRIGRALFGDGE